MKSNAYINGQDILNWYKTPLEMAFTDKGFPILEPLTSLSIPRRGLRTLPFNYALSNKDKDYFVITTNGSLTTPLHARSAWAVPHGFTLPSGQVYPSGKSSKL